MGFWTLFFVSLAVNTVAYLLLAKPDKSNSATAQKFSVPTTQHGGWPGVLAGSRWIDAPHVPWYGDTKAVPIKKSGGK
jgi:hypothetical protein